MIARKSANFLWIIHPFNKANYLLKLIEFLFLKEIRKPLNPDFSFYWET
jgi:hypothetical protein